MIILIAKVALMVGAVMSTFMFAMFMGIITSKKPQDVSGFHLTLALVTFAGSLVFPYIAGAM